MQFNSELDITAQLDISALDSTQRDPVDLELKEIFPTPFGVPAGARRYVTAIEISPDTVISSGPKVIQLIVTNEDGEVDTRDIDLDFTNDTVITPAVIEAGSQFTVRFTSESNITAQLDISALDSTQGVIDLELEEISPADFDLEEMPATPVVLLGARHYKTVIEVSPDTEIESGEKIIRLIINDADGEEIEVRHISVDFTNPAGVNGFRATNRQLATFANQVGESDGGTEINVRPDGKIYTNSPKIPLTGQIRNIPDTSRLEVEVFVEGSSMGVTPVEPDGRFRLDRILLKPGPNRVMSLVRSAAQLQSSASVLQTVIFDPKPPEVTFVNLPTHTSRASLEVRTRYSDNTGTTPEFVTLVVNGEAQSADTAQNEVTTTIALKDGENTLTLTAVDAAGNISAPIEGTVILDATRPETAPTKLRAGISFSGTEIILNWEADANASAYNLYRSESPIHMEGGSTALTPIVSNLKGTQFTDINVNVGLTYYYALTSISQAGVEGAKFSDNTNVTILYARRGGTAAISDRTRLTARAHAISDDPTLYTAVSIESPSLESLPLLAGAIDGTARRFASTSQSGSDFAETFVQPVKIALPYPTDTDFPEALQIFHLDSGKWTQLEDKEIEANRGVVTVNAFGFGAYQLAKPLEQPWDATGDGVVDIFDLVLVGSNFGQTGPGIPGDINQDEVVNIIDLVLVGSHFGEVFAPTAAAPPPANRGAQAEVSMTAGQSTQTRQGVQERLVTVEVNADSTLPLGGFMFDVGYDPYLLALVDLQEGTLLKRDGTRSFWLEPKFQPGRVAKIASIALAGHSEGTALTTKADTLTEITFRLKGDIDDALESIQIQNLALSDRDAQSIPFRLDGRIRYDRQPAPLTYSLNQNYPNPFNPETWIPYQLANPGEVTLRIYDASGHLVRTLHLGFQSAGAYQSRDKAAYWDGRNMNGEKVASGIYFYQIEAGQFSATRKMVIVK